MFNPARDRIQTVSELTASIRGLLEISFPFTTVLGEISNLRRPSSGHLYFTLKDHKAQLRAVFFKTQQRYLDCEPADGLEVICRGRISLYEARGEYQLIVDTLSLRGAGSLQLAFERLKEKLGREGLFAAERKRPLPFLPGRIVLITSPQGAAVHDFLKIAGERFPALPIAILPVRVQGEEAATEIAEAIDLANREFLGDVIVLCRGGGSIEDLQAFNEEILARAIAGSRIPTVAAIGHEVDFTIADFVADLRAPTPSAAAEAVIPSRDQLASKLAAISRRLTGSITTTIETLRQKVVSQRRALGDPTSLLDHFRLSTDHALAALHFAFSRMFHQQKMRLANLNHILAGHNPEERLLGRRQQLRDLTRRLNAAISHQQELRRAALTKNAALLHAVSPLAVLGRGYGIIQTEDGRIVRDAVEVAPGDRLRLTLHRGRIDTRVTGCETDPES